MKINQPLRTSRTLVAAAALVAVLGAMPIAGAQAANMRVKQATRVAPAASSVTVGKRTPLRLGRGTRLAAKTAATKGKVVKKKVKEFGFEVVATMGWEVGSTRIDTIVGLKDSSCRQVMMKAGRAH